MFRRRNNNNNNTKKDDLEVNITDGKDIVYDEEIPIEDPEKQNETSSESDLQSETPELPEKPTKAPSSLDFPTRPKSGAGVRRLLSRSDSDSDDGLMVMEPLKGPLPGEYDPEKFNELPVNPEIKDMFQYITKYTPQHLNLDYKFKPFVPDYIPAVGDIDAFLKVVHPERMLTNGDTAANFADLGLDVLDEPAANQSDSALLHLQLRAVSVTTNKDNKNMIIKKIENVEKNTKTIDKWIIDISDLHRAKPPPMVKYTNSMPDIDNLMQEWPPAVELRLRKDGFPSHKLDTTLREYIELTCAIFDIPIYDNKRIQSLHLLFSLFVAIKNSQLYNINLISEFEDDHNTDQLILD